MSMTDGPSAGCYTRRPLLKCRVSCGHKLVSIIDRAPGNLISNYKAMQGLFRLYTLQAHEAIKLRGYILVAAQRRNALLQSSGAV